ncbi:TPA: tripartite tricarboxylate transporter permease, partial [Escherichia fergusonii]|nr:tripartite tricarboxylate transporter permease [Escherichia fergusonii]
MGDLFLQGILTVGTPTYLLYILAGVTVGIIFGAVPGLTAVMAITLFLPVTYGMEAALGISLLAALYIGATSGGLISAILLKIPGTPSSVATCFEGHPMLEKGEGVKALGVGVVYSFIGTLLGVATLVFIAPPLAEIALQFGPHEYFSIAIFSLTLIATLSSGNMIRGIFSGAVGMACATVGLSPIDAVPRFEFGMSELSNGFAVLTVLIGLFAVSELFKVAETAHITEDAQVGKITMRNVRGFGFSLKEFFGQMPNCFRSSAIGIGVGILPGIGSGTSNILAYLVAKKQSKHPEKYGTGIIDGVVASESANNAGIGGALVPLMTLGIPGDAVTAMLLGGFMLHGITPGPMLFMTQGALVYTIFAALIVASFAMLVIEFYGLRIFAHLLNVPKHILMPVILVLCIVGAFGLNNRIFDIWTILLFGGVGYFFVKYSIAQ